MKTKIAIAGYGWFGKMHHKVYMAMEDVEIVGIFDVNEDSFNMEKKSAQDAFHKDMKSVSPENKNTRFFTNLEQMLAETRPDILDIVVPENIHINIALVGLKYKCHLVIEKPMTVNYSDAKNIFDKARQNDLQVYVGHVLRFDARYAALAHMLSDVDGKDIRHISMERNFQSKSHYVYGRVHPAYSACIHDVDIIRWMSKSKVTEVSAFANYYLNREYPDVIVAILKLESGALCTIQNVWHISESCPYGFEFSSKFITKEDTFMIRNEPVISKWGKEVVEYPEMFFWPQINGKVVGALKDELTHYIYCAKKNIESPILPNSEVLDSMKIADSIVQSINTKQTIRL